MNAVYVSLVTASLFFLVGWVVMLLVGCAFAVRGDSPSPNWPAARSRSRAWPQKLKPLLVESHLLAHAAQEPASTVSLPEEVPG
jgi:hypothetical protein